MVVLVLLVSDIGMVMLFKLLEVVNVMNPWFQSASHGSSVHPRLCHKSQGVQTTEIPQDRANIMLMVYIGPH